MATRKKAPYGRVNVITVPSAEDVEVKVNRLEVEGEELVEIREWIPSNQTYGRGLTMPIETFEKMRAAL